MFAGAHQKNKRRQGGINREERRMAKTPEEMKAFIARSAIKAKARVELNELVAKFMEQDGLTLPEAIDVVGEELTQLTRWLVQEFEALERKGK